MNDKNNNLYVLSPKFMLLFLSLKKGAINKYLCGYHLCCMHMSVIWYISYVMKKTDKKCAIIIIGLLYMPQNYKDNNKYNEPLILHGYYKYTHNLTFSSFNL